MRSKMWRGIGKYVWRNKDLGRSKIGRDMRTIVVNVNDLFILSSTSTSTERVKLTRVAARSRAKVGWSGQATFRYSESQLKCVTAPPQPQAGINLHATPRLMRQKKNLEPPPHTAERDRPRSKGHPTILDDHSNWNGAFDASRFQNVFIIFFYKSQTKTAYAKIDDRDKHVEKTLSNRP